MTEDDEKELFRRLSRIDKRIKHIGGIVVMGAAAAVAYYMKQWAEQDWGADSRWAGAVAVVTFIAVVIYIGRRVEYD
jgi:hypothetical protein